MTYLLNNWQSLNHPHLYKEPRAFYDLYASEPQGKHALAMKPGDVCYVLSQDRGQVVVNKSAFDATQVRDGGVYVMLGEHLAREAMPRGMATPHPIYRHFFSATGAVKRTNVIVI